MLIAFATTPQFVSWRNSVRGSWFIQAVCEVFSVHAGDMDVVEMLTEVNKKVATSFQTSQGPNILKQMPEVRFQGASCRLILFLQMTSRLLKKFYFWPCRDSAVWLLNDCLYMSCMLNTLISMPRILTPCVYCSLILILIRLSFLLPIYPSRRTIPVILSNPFPMCEQHGNYNNF